MSERQEEVKNKAFQGIVAERKNEVYRLEIIYNIEIKSVYFKLRLGIKLPFFDLSLCGFKLLIASLSLSLLICYKDAVGSCTQRP